MSPASYTARRWSLFVICGFEGSWNVDKSDSCMSLGSRLSSSQSFWRNRSQAPFCSFLGTKKAGWDVFYARLGVLYCENGISYLNF